MNDEGAPDREEAGPPVERVLVTVEEAAAMLAIGRTTTFRLIAEGELEVTKIGRSTRVPVDAVSDLVVRLRARSATDNTRPPVKRSPRRSA